MDRSLRMTTSQWNELFLLCSQWCDPSFHWVVVSGKAILEDAQKISDSVKLVAQNRHFRALRNDSGVHPGGMMERSATACFARRGAPTET